ncbi:hypothetical protein [Methylotuvimicrobium sp. KM2]|uniref:hypothetical protein n=1 Tax=Methylotuvimicrobium sp. KM2 TaxID=3133976 RepID=UPI003101510E
MTEYRRFYYPGATCFFTVNLAERHGNPLLTERIDVLYEAFAYVKNEPLTKGYVRVNIPIADQNSAPGCPSKDAVNPAPKLAIILNIAKGLWNLGAG